MVHLGASNASTRRTNSATPGAPFLGWSGSGLFVGGVRYNFTYSTFAGHQSGPAGILRPCHEGRTVSREVEVGFSVLSGLDLGTTRGNGVVGEPSAGEASWPVPEDECDPGAGGNKHHSLCAGHPQRTVSSYPPSCCALHLQNLCGKRAPLRWGLWFRMACPSSLTLQL